MTAANATKIRVCQHCSTELVREGDLLVDARSGDYGGTYDICPGNEQGHVVAKRTHPCNICKSFPVPVGFHACTVCD